MVFEMGVKSAADLEKLQAALADILSEITLFRGLFEPNSPYCSLRMEKEDLKMEN